LAFLVAGLPDRGIFADLNARVSLSVPAWIAPKHRWLRVDPKHGVLTLYEGEAPLKAYPLPLREEDTQELARVAPAAKRIELISGHGEDRDEDGILDPLDIALGAKKLVENRARYVENYVTLDYPGGDVPRSEGVCSDTVIRALRNAGIDLQREVHEDI